MVIQQSRAMIEEKLNYIIESAVIAIGGGIAGFLINDKHSVFEFIVYIFVGGFIGVLTGQLCAEYVDSESISFFLIGASGIGAKGLALIYKDYILVKFKRESDTHG